MVLDFPPRQRSASLQFGITIRAWSLVFAADAFVSSRESLKAMDLIALRCRQGILRVHTSSHAVRRSQYLRDPTPLDPFKAGIAGIPLELLLSFRETIIELALRDAEQKHLKYVRAAHEKHTRSHGGLPFERCLRGATHRQLCDACKRHVGPRTDYTAINNLLSTYSLSLVSSSTRTPLLMSPPYSQIEPHPWVIALPTHHSQLTSRSPSYLPLYTPPQHGLNPDIISFFSPSFMRITSSDIMRFRILVRAWRLIVIELSGTVASRGSESSSGQSRCNPRPDIPEAMVDMEVMERVQGLQIMGHCGPRWMLLKR